MCGINGFKWNDEIQIKNMNNIIKHRGPDDEGMLIDKNITMGHMRFIWRCFCMKLWKRIFSDGKGKN